MELRLLSTDRDGAGRHPSPWVIALVPLLIPNELVEIRRGEARVHGWMRTCTGPEVAEPFIADLQLAIRAAVAATLAILISAHLGV